MRTRRPTLLVGLTVLACSQAVPAVAQSANETLLEAQEAYLQADYGRVVSLLEPLIGGADPTTTNALVVRESRKYLGAAYVLTDQEGPARTQFRRLLIESGDEIGEQSLDRAVFSTSVHRVFRSVRDELVRQRSDERAERARAAAEAEERRQRAALELVALAQEERVEIRHEPLLALVPFGAGQFQNGATDLGVFFAVSEAVTGLTAAISLGAWLPLYQRYEESLRPGAMVTVDPAVLEALSYVNWISISAMVVLAVAGVIEAFVNFVPSHTVRQRRSVPGRLLRDLEAGVHHGSLPGQF